MTLNEALEVTEQWRDRVAAGNAHAHVDYAEYLEAIKVITENQEEALAYRIAQAQEAEAKARIEALKTRGRYKDEVLAWSKAPHVRAPQEAAALTGVYPTKTVQEIAAEKVAEEEQELEQISEKIKETEDAMYEVGPQEFLATNDPDSEGYHKTFSGAANIGSEGRKEFWTKEQELWIRLQRAKTAAGQLSPGQEDPPELAQAKEEYKAHIKQHYTKEQLTPGGNLVTDQVGTTGFGGKFKTDKDEFERLQRQKVEQVKEREATPAAQRRAAELRAQQKEKEDKERVERESGGYATTRRFLDQCFLIKSFDQILNFYSQQGLQSHNVYSNFSMITDEIEKSNNLLLARPGANILKFCPEHIAPLVPEIRFLKVYSESAFNESLSEEDRTHAFRFSTEFDESNFLGKQRRVGDDAGIQSFTWHLHGETEADAGKVVTGKGVFFFRNMADFVAELKPDKKTLKDMPYRYADLGMYAATNSNFELKVSVGWSSPQAKNLEEMFGRDQAKKISNASQNSKIVFYFNVEKYEYDIKEDGSLVVTTTFTGHVDQTLRNMDYDIFQGKINPTNSPLHYRLGILKAIRDTLQKTIEATKKLGDEVFWDQPSNGDIVSFLSKRVHNASSLPPKVKEELAEDPRNEVQNPQQYFVMILNSLLKDAFENFSPFPLASLTQGDFDQFGFKLLDKIYGPQKADNYSIGEVGSLLLNKTELEIEAVTGELPEYHANLMNRILSHPNNTISVASIDKENFTKYQRRYRRGSLRAADKPSVETTPTLLYRIFGEGHAWSTIENSSTTGLFEAPALQDDKYKIYFMKLGDIVEAAMAEFAEQRGVEKSGNRDIGVILGSLNVGLPPFANKNISLADLPISLNAFYHWYTTQVVEKDKPKLMLIDFLRSIINTLVIPACERATGTEYVANRYNFSIPVAPRASPSEWPIQPGKSYNLQKLRKVKKNQRVPSGGSSGRHITYTYIFLHSVSARLDLKGNRGDDEKDYVFHLSAGEECSLVKSLSFHAADVPGIQEARDEAAYGTRNNKNLQGRLMLVHNVDIDMVGNTMFQPGMLVHVAPKYAGLGRSKGTDVYRGRFASHKEIAAPLGIGGYYQVLDVDSSIDSSGFWTSLKTLFIAPSVS